MHMHFENLFKRTFETYHIFVLLGIGIGIWHLEKKRSKSLAMLIINDTI